MITGRQLLEALQVIDRQTPTALDESLYATFGNDENGNADLIPVADLLQASDESINGVAETLMDGVPPVVVLDDEGKESPLALLEEMLAMMEHTSDKMMQNDFERFQAVKQLTADLKEGLNAL